MNKIISLSVMLCTTFLTLSNSVMAQHPQELRITGSVVSFVEKTYGAKFKFGEFTRDSFPMNVKTFYLYNDGRLGAIWSTDEMMHLGEDVSNAEYYFTNYSYDSDKHLIREVNDKKNEVTEYIYTNNELKEINIYIKGTNALQYKRKYYKKNGLKYSILYDSEGREKSGSLYIYNGQSYSKQEFKGYDVLFYSNNHIIKRIEGIYTAANIDGGIAYSYNKSGDVEKEQTIVENMWITCDFTYEYDTRGNWIKCVEKKQASTGSTEYTCYERNFTYSDNPAFEYIDPIEERARQMREKFIQDSIIAREKHIQDSIAAHDKFIRDSIKHAEELRIETERRIQLEAEAKLKKENECFQTNVRYYTRDLQGIIDKVNIDDNGNISFKDLPPTKYSFKEEIQIDGYTYICYKGEGTDNYIVFLSPTSRQYGFSDKYCFIMDAHTLMDKNHYEFGSKAVKKLSKYFNDKNTIIPLNIQGVVISY